MKPTKENIVFISEGADIKELNYCITGLIPSEAGLEDQAHGIKSIGEAHFMAEFLSRDEIPYCITKNEYCKGVRYDVWREWHKKRKRIKVCRPKKIEGYTVVI